MDCDQPFLRPLVDNFQKCAGARGRVGCFPSHIASDGHLCVRLACSPLLGRAHGRFFPLAAWLPLEGTIVATRSVLRAGTEAGLRLIARFKSLLLSKGSHAALQLLSSGGHLSTRTTNLFPQGIDLLTRVFCGLTSTVLQLSSRFTT